MRFDLSNSHEASAFQIYCYKLASKQATIIHAGVTFKLSDSFRYADFLKLMHDMISSGGVINIDDSDIDNVVIVSGDGSASLVSDEVPETERCKLDKQQMSLPFAECESCDPSCCDTSLPLTNAPIIGFKRTKKVNDLGIVYMHDGKVLTDYDAKKHALCAQNNCEQLNCVIIGFSARILNAYTIKINEAMHYLNGHIINVTYQSVL